MGGSLSESTALLPDQLVPRRDLGLHTHLAPDSVMKSNIKTGSL